MQTEQAIDTAIVKVDAAQYGLQATEASQVEAVFIPMIQKMTALEGEFNEIKAAEITPEICTKAKELHMKYVKVRTGTAEIHKKAKAYYLAGGRFVDGWKNAQEFASQGKEQALLEIEKHFERIEEARIKAIEEARKEQLKEFTTVVPDALGWMTEETFNIYMAGAKQQFELKIEAERQEAIKAEIAAKERDEKAKEDERIRLENQRLRDELAKKEAEEQKERDRIAAEQREKDKEQKKADAAPDKVKLSFWINGIDTTPPTISNPATMETRAEIQAKYEGFKRWALQKIAEIK